MSKIFIKSLCSKLRAKPEDVLHLLAEHDIIRGIVPSVALSNEMLKKGFDAIDLPISEEVVLCIATHGKWEGDRMTVRHLDEQRVVISQATFKEKVSLTSDNLFVRDDDYSRIEQELHIAEAELSETESRNLYKLIWVLKDMLLDDGEERKYTFPIKRKFTSQTQLITQIQGYDLPGLKERSLEGHFKKANDIIAPLKTHFIKK
jgi:hypothetical protein